MVDLGEAHLLVEVDSLDSCSSAAWSIVDLQYNPDPTGLAQKVHPVPAKIPAWVYSQIFGVSNIFSSEGETTWQSTEPPVLILALDLAAISTDLNVWQDCL